MLSVKVKSEIFGITKPEAKIPEINLRLISEKITLKEVIERSVKEQIKAMQKISLTNTQIYDHLTHQYLDDEKIQQLASTGKISIHKSSVNIDLEMETQRAVRAFTKNRFKVFIDGRELSNLNETHPLYDGCNVTFIRLIPLIGG
ncbi:hypothetical protein MO867_16365 [Microbulbifer sp. OS29]|uniref:Uncharacterized protein n=1 Tax=Microbulbifer okhotskensis TaxID=2926617 RepID=A0A9X2J7L4_9GAMM|nr:hypothetical protein [Microbulbifer okhotskensis]MCO1335910.1 hypothetical protein [Microbulbifer okhotskensis]